MDVNSGDLKILHQKISKLGVFFRHYLYFLQHYAWLESSDQDVSFDTNILGSLIVSSVLWVLSSHNTLSVTHSDTASYIKKCCLLLYVCSNLCAGGKCMKNKSYLIKWVLSISNNNRRTDRQFCVHYRIFYICLLSLLLKC